MRSYSSSQARTRRTVDNWDLNPYSGSDMNANKSTDELLSVLRSAEVLSAETRQALAKAAESLGPQMAEIAEAMAPNIDAFQRAAEELIKGIDLKALQAATDAAVSSISLQAAISIDQQVLQAMRNQAQEISAQFEAIVSSLNSSIATGVARSRLQASGRSLKNWKRRWADDAAAAEAAFSRLSEVLTAARRLGDLPAETPVVGLTGDVDVRDVDIAELYYSGLLTQQQVGETVGLTQASVASRLKRIDRIIAREVLVRSLQRVATDEGWDIFREGSVDLGGADVRFDLLAIVGDHGDAAARLGIDVQIVDANTYWSSGANQIQGWSEYLASIEPRVHSALALYDLSIHRAFLCLETDLAHAAAEARPGRDVAQPLFFRDIRQLLPQTLSLSDAAKRAGE